MKQSSKARSRVVNRIAHYRQELDGMTQEGLAIRVGTSQQQISRIEKGQKITPTMAIAVAKALDQPLGTIFPDMGEMNETQTPASEFYSRFNDAGFEIGTGEWVAAQLVFRMRGFIDEFTYVVESNDVDRLNRILRCPRDEQDQFFAIWAQGRYVTICLADIVSMRISNGEALPLSQGFDDLRIFIRGEAEPLVYETEEVDDPEWDHWHQYAGLDAGYYSRFIRVRDEEDDEDILINTDDIVIIECPSKALIKEMYREEGRGD